jgi:hypothetical protein
VIFLSLGPNRSGRAWLNILLLLRIRNITICRIGCFGSVIRTLVRRGAWVRSLLIFRIVRSSPVIEPGINYIGINVGRSVAVRSPAAISPVVIVASIATAMRASAAIAATVRPMRISTREAATAIGKRDSRTWRRLQPAWHRESTGLRKT